MSSGSQKEMVILLIGPSGSGKSSFVKSLTTEPVKVVQVHGLKPCTAECKAYRVEPIIHSNWAFTLIDTPGFVDVEEHNLEILENIAETLTNLASDRVFGAIYFHNITEGRMKGSSLSVLGIFKAICGDKFFPHVAFVTTMWDTVKPRYHENLEQVQKELEEGPMKVRGAPGIFKRLRNDDEGSKEVLRYFTLLARKRPTPPPLQLVRELRGETKNVGSTAAGREILEDKRSGPTACCTVM